MFARLTKEYGFSWEAIMAMPLKRFWFYSNMVERLWAERDLRQVQLLAAATTGDGFKAATDALQKERGTIYVWETTVEEIVIDPETGLDKNFDREGLAALKARITRG